MSRPRLPDLDLDRVRTLRNPHRATILEILRAEGPLTTGQLVQRTRRSRWNIRKLLMPLEHLGMIEVQHAPPGSGREENIYRAVQL